MNDSRDDLGTADLSTADLAGQTPGRAHDDGYADPVRDEPATDSVGSTRADGAAYDEPDRTDLYGTDRTGADHELGTTDRAGVDGDLGTTDRAGVDGDLGTTDRGLGTTDRGLDGADRGPDGSVPLATDHDLGTGDRSVDGSGPVASGAPLAPSTTDTPGTPVERSSTVDSSTGSLLGSSDSEGFRARWTGVQTGFVDAPREAVQKADALVAELMQHLARTFADERSSLEQQWDRGDDVPTDDLRDAFQRYRSFFERLLAT